MPILKVTAATPGSDTRIVIVSEILIVLNALYDIECVSS
jgi:hypothetical protein